MHYRLQFWQRNTNMCNSLWWSLETWSRSFKSRSRRSQVSSQSRGNSVSVSKDFGLGLELFVSFFILESPLAGSTLLRTIFELFFQEFCYETHRLLQKRWESAKKFLFWEAKWKHVFFRSAFQSTLLKHAGEVFVVLGDADFFKFKNASELSWGKVLLIRVLYREQRMRHSWSVTLT